MKELDFLPKTFHEARRRSRLMRRNVLYSLGLAIAFASVHAINTSHLRSARAGLADLRTDDRARSLQRQELQALQARQQTLADRLELVSRLEDDAPLDVVLAEIAAQMNDAIAIRSLQVKTLPPAEIAPEDRDPLLDRGPTRVVLGGVAADDMQVGILLGHLGGSALFKDVKLSFSREIQDAGRRMREFELTFVLIRVAFDQGEEE